MRPKTEIFVMAAALSWAAATASGQPNGPSDETGVIVEEVEAGYAAEKAGLRPGDEILSWSREQTGGRILSPFHLKDIEVEQSFRGAVVLSGRRGSQPMTWTLPHDSWWRMYTRPVLSSQAATLYCMGEERIAAGDLTGGEELWRAAVVGLMATGGRLRASWLLDRLASRLTKAGKLTEAEIAHEEALGTLGEDPIPAIQVLINWGDRFLNRNAWDRASNLYEQALALQRQAAPESMLEAAILVFLGDTAWYKGDLANAVEFHRQAGRIHQQLAPLGLNTASSWTNWANIELERGNLERAEQLFRHADEIIGHLDPGSLLHALIILGLGSTAYFRGDLAGAEELYRQALPLFEKHNPDGVEVFSAVHNLAEIAEKRGHLATSETLLRRALLLTEKLGKDRRELVDVLGSLARVAGARGDLDTAHGVFRRVLEIAEALIPDSPKLAEALVTFADLARRRGDYTAAREALRRALVIQEQQAPGSFYVAKILLQRAALELASGEDLAAEEDFRRARTLLENQVPGSLLLAEALQGLGNVAVRRGRFQQAIELYRQTLNLQRKRAPETTAEAEVLYSLGHAERRAGQAKEGTRDLCLALDILDRQRARLGGTPEAKTSFEATLGDFYYACLEGLIQLGQPSEAFHALERGRARSFLALLAERDLRLADLPPELAAERRRVDTDYDRVQSQLALLSTGRDDAEIARLTGELRDLRTRQEEITARIRRESPRSAALQDPEPLDLAGARAALDPGTVLLEYTVGPERSWLFVVQPAGASGPGLSVFQIAAGAKVLGEEVESFRRLLKRPGSERVALQAQARRLYALLIHPAEKRIAQAQRILVSPDGPLHTLPFAVLIRGSRYLVEWKPIHSVLSATVYAELVRSRPAARKPEDEHLVAFGDPVYLAAAPEAPADPEVQDAVRRGLALKPLPSTRKEVEAIAALYPRARAYLGREATEEKAKSLGPDSRLIHFACHGLLDEQFPLNSSLALTLPQQQTEGQENGLLQAWEIFERLRLGADLVTLSACDTALGREMGGEGLVGLTRAFQYAGARSVLASVWGVSDLSTARFMQRFYGNLRGGKTKDEALRAAQIAQIRGKSGSAHPFYWAAFQLTGDWR